jgi:ABC-type phosphate transport system substrate-binding protein
MRIFLSLIGLSCALLLTASPASAAPDLVVIVNPASGIERISRDELTALYMGRTKKLASGITALPIDQAASNPEKARFYRELINKELPEVNSYWARLIFSGQGSPPRQADNSAEVLDIVSSNKGAIGYLPRNAADRRVRIVLDLNAQ